MISIFAGEHCRRVLRRQFARLSFALLFTLGLAGCGDDASPRLTPLDSDAIILAFGDSLTYGTGAKGSQSYPAQLARLIDREVVREGVPGEISADGLERLEEVLEEHEPDLVILCHGGNDILRNLDLDDTKANLLEMIDLIRQSGASVVMIGVPAKGLSLSTHQLYLDVASEADVPIEDEVVGDVLSSSGLKADAVHPNAAGYAVFAEEMAELLKAHGAL